MTSPAIKLAREMQADFVEASGAVTYFFGPGELETFYRLAQAQALRDAAEEIGECGGRHRSSCADQLRRMADELEARK